MKRLDLASLLCGIVACGGCGRGTVDFQAKVTLDGEPLEGAAVTLIGTGEARSRAATGISDAGGNVDFTTFEPGDGVLPGEYKVLVSKMPKTLEEEFINFDPINPEDVAKMQARERSTIVAYTPSALPRVYLDAAQSPITCTVPPPEEPVVFALDSKAGKQKP
jgi:hypothetical protein